MFPPVNSGGLIEARPSCAAWLVDRTPFPPVNSGGLIEACLGSRDGARAVSVSAGEFRRPH